LCDASALGGEHLVVNLVPDSYGPASTELSDGTTVPQSATIDIARLEPSQQLDVVIFRDPNATVVSTTFS